MSVLPSSIDWSEPAVAGMFNSGAGFSASRALRRNSRVAGHERPPEPRQSGRQAVLRVAGQDVHLARQIALQGRLSERRGQGRWIAPGARSRRWRQALIATPDEYSPSTTPGSSRTHASCAINILGVAGPRKHYAGPSTVARLAPQRGREVRRVPARQRRLELTTANCALGEGLIIRFPRPTSFAGPACAVAASGTARPCLRLA
jgi:hypothetical protein